MDGETGPATGREKYGMKLEDIMMKALAALLFTFALPLNAYVKTITLGSGDKWKVTDAAGNNLGLSQNVCLNCPAGATSYGYKFGEWTANLPGATWMWARKLTPNAPPESDITGATTPAGNAEFTSRYSISDLPTQW